MSTPLHKVVKHLNHPPTHSRYHVTLIAVRGEGETELKLNPGLNHILQERDTIFYIGFTREEYSKVRGPVNTRSTLWHACASFAVLAMATSGINPYELEEKYGSHEVKVEAKEVVKGEQDGGGSLISSEGEDAEVKFYLGGNQNSSSELKLIDTADVHKQVSPIHKRPSQASQASPIHKRLSQASQASSTHQRPSLASQISATNFVNLEDNDSNMETSLTKEELDDQQKCDMLRGVKLLRFHSQATSSHTSVPVKVNLLHRDSSTGLTSVHPPGSSSASSSSSPLVVRRKISAPSSMPMRQGSIPVSALAHQNSIPVSATLRQSSVPGPVSTLLHQQTTSPRRAVVPPPPPKQVTSNIQSSARIVAESATTITTGSGDPLLEKSPEPPLYSEPSDPFLPATRGSHVCFKRLSDVPEEILMERERSVSALSERALLSTLKDAEEGRGNYNGRGTNSHVPSSRNAIELSSVERSVHMTRNVTYQPAPNTADNLRPPPNAQTKRVNLVPPPLDLNITRSASEGKLPGMLEEVVVDPDTPGTLRRGGFYSSEQSILNPSTPSSAIRHVGMRMPSPVFARRRPTILSNFSRKLSVQGERTVPPVMQEEVCMYVLMEVGGGGWGVHV